MMLCNDTMSGGLPSAAAAAGVGANGQSQCQIDAQPVSTKTRDLLLDPATADHRLSATRPAPCLGESRPKKTVTPNSQSDWHLNFAEGRARNTEITANPRPDISDTMSSRAEKVTATPSSMDVVLVQPCSPAEVRTTKRVNNSLGTTHVAKKRMRLDANPTLLNPDPVGHTNALAQEHWKKGALGHLSRDVAPSLTESASKEKVSKVSKDSLSHHLNHIDSLIVQHEMALARLHTTLEQLEEAMPKSSEDSGNQEKELEQLETKPQLSEAEHVLVENRRKAEASHAFMNKVKLPESFLYQRPSDTAVYHENKHKFMVFKKRLATFLKNKQEAQNTRMETLKKQYNGLHVAWRRKMETIENDQKARCTQELAVGYVYCYKRPHEILVGRYISVFAFYVLNSSKKVQEYFDKIFPEMKKQEEEKLQRYCSKVLPSTESDGSNNKDQKDAANKPEIQMEMVMEKLRSLAAETPALLDTRCRRLCFLNENGRIEEPAAVNSASMLKCSFWTEQERDLFVEKYVRQPKKFGSIASYMENKNVHDCVQFYYLTKKAVGYKKLQRQKYSRKPKMRGANNAKEDKAEGKNSGVHPCRERLLLSCSMPTNAAEPKNAVELEPTEEPLPAISTGADVVAQVGDGGSSIPLEPSAVHPSAIPSDDSSLVSLNPPSPEQEKKKNHLTDVVEVVTPPLTPCDGRADGASDALDSVAKSCRLQSPLKELEAPVDDSGKAEDDDSIATLSADEGAAHSQDDESRIPLEEAPSLPPTLPTQVSTMTEQPVQNKSLHTNRLLSFRNDSHPDGHLGCLSQRDTEALLRKTHPSVGNEVGRRERISLATASPLLTSEGRGFVRPESEFDDRSKGVHDHLPVGLDARRTSPQVYSPPAGNQSVSDGRVVLPVAGMSSFVRNSGSPARIRDLIHAAIKKTLQVTDRKPSDSEVNAKRHAEAKKFKPSSDVPYQPAAVCSSVVENEAEDLSVRHPRRVSSAAETSGNVLQPINVPCQPRNVDSPYHLRPAHNNPPSSQPDPRSGYLLELAIVAEYENRKRSERDHQGETYESNSQTDTLEHDIRKETFERDPRRETFERDPRRETFERDPRKENFYRDAHSGRYDFTAAVDPADQMLRQRETPMHRGSIMQGTPIPTSRFHAPQFPAEALVERFGILPSSAVRNSGSLPEPPPSRGPFHPTVPHISSEHMKLLRDDFRTAQQLRSMQQAPPGTEPIDRNFRPYRSYPDVAHAPVSGQSDTRGEFSQPSKAGPFPGRIPNDLSVPPHWQHPAVRLNESHAYAGDPSRGGSGQRSLAGNRADSDQSNTMSMPLRNGPFESTRPSYLPDKRNVDGFAPSQWQIPPTASAPVRFAKGGSCLPEQNNWPKISEGCSAAQLIEWIISIQISQPDAAERGIPSSILNRIEETSAATLPVSSDPWNMSTAFRTRHDGLRMSRDNVTMSTAPRTALPDRATATSGDRMSEKSFQPTAAISESGFPTRSEVPDRGFSSGSGINDRVFPSLMDIPNKTFLSGILGTGGHGADKSDTNQRKRVSTVESCMESIFMDMSRESSSQSSTDANRIAMRTFLAGSDRPSYEDARQMDVPRFSSGLHQSRVSSPWASAPARREGSSSGSEHPPEKAALGSRRADPEVDDPGGKTDGVGSQDHFSGRRSTAGFNWKTKILREHQKQQRENEDRDSPFVASPSTKSVDQENRLNERQQMRRLSSSDLSSQSVGDTASAVGRTDDATVLSCTVSGLSSPVEGSRPVLGRVCAVQDDQDSPIAGKHQMISTLLSSSRSGRPPGRTMPLSASSLSSSSSAAAAAATAGPVSSDSQLSKQTVARSSRFSSQSDKTIHSPAAPCGSESPESNSPGLDMPGRLCIHLDSTEDLKSPSPDS